MKAYIHMVVLCMWKILGFNVHIKYIKYVLVPEKIYLKHVTEEYTNV